MAIKKNELYSSLWASCDELRGGMDASQYKDYVLTMLFMKYVSDKYKGDPYGMIVIPQGASFDDMVALKGDKEIGDKINKIISALAEENDLKSVIDVADFNDEDKLGKGKEMIDRLSKLIGIFEGLDLSSNRADGDDLLGDAYEYLMRHFATESGKSKGQFYTPSEVSRILSKVIGINKNTPQDATVYDPTCGSGSLLLKASDEAPRGLSIFGQEMDNATSALARMNMILHNNATAKIWKGNTISDPQWKEANGQLKTFDFAVANPPFSNKNWTNGINPKEDEFDRFSWGIPPEKNGDYTFLLHIIKSLKSTGKGAVILPHGVLFRGNAEARIRENLIKQGYIKGIIGLPANLFYGTGIPACIIVIDKEHAQARESIFMVDASKGFIKDGNKNRLRSQDIYKIVEVFTKQLEQPRFSRMVPLSEIVANDYNLNIPRYIDSSEPEDLHDLSAHLQGGIPNRDIDALERYWQIFPSIRAALFKPAREGYSEALVKASEVKNTILNHDEFKQFATNSLQHYHVWARASNLAEISVGDQPKALIAEISESLLQSYSQTPLLSKYDIYQILMDYWSDTMQDDVYVLVQDGWSTGKVLRELEVKKGEKLRETPDLVIGKTKYKAELIPPALIVARYFADEQTKIDTLQSKLDSASQELETYLEENSGDDGLLNEALNDKDKVTKATVTARLKIATDPDEKSALKQAQKLFDNEANAKKALKKAQDALDLAVFKQYPKLSIDEIKNLIVDDKWLATLQSNIEAEIERVTQQLANRVKELEERYNEPLPAITKSVEDLNEKVAGHLKAMGLEWEL
ncbi:MULTISPECIES: type I restriction-modification system subunit M [Proteus]|uniref:type I restriction-modification system subunit M n=1 Tax=Proteus TaxID=583 RepID=UPI000D7E246D|nr:MULTISPECIES: type I restriction-modification system subunit M [Proteus]AWS53538.1 type I restriction-modification system subunit M [Proteus mirabilis]EKU0761483.1 type I restriction-modification system subunit M [Proteus mirabilis]EKX9204580.1 type I restriction-modification system subunit M [Proteus mirabilis]ELA7738991.1 type I restriction-modification system subunit M [Proteus mirabilis]ELB1205666.1 type I restriction-modification system subunit M [Proteus mirabilis]